MACLRVRGCYTLSLVLTDLKPGWFNLARPADRHGDHHTSIILRAAWVEMDEARARSQGNPDSSCTVSTGWRYEATLSACAWEFLPSPCQGGAGNAGRRPWSKRNTPPSPNRPLTTTTTHTGTPADNSIPASTHSPRVNCGRLSPHQSPVSGKRRRSKWCCCCSQRSPRPCEDRALFRDGDTHSPCSQQLPMKMSNTDMGLDPTERLIKSRCIVSVAIVVCMVSGMLALLSHNTIWVYRRGVVFWKANFVHW